MTPGVDGVWLVIAGLWAIAALVSQYEDALLLLADWLEEDDDADPVEDVHQLYLHGEIDEDELAERLEVLVDDRAQTIRDLTDDVDGIGDELSRDLAREFDSVADLQAADAEDLQEVDGIGETRAENLTTEL